MCLHKSNSLSWRFWRARARTSAESFDSSRLLRWSWSCLALVAPLAVQIDPVTFCAPRPLSASVDHSHCNQIRPSRLHRGHRSRVIHHCASPGSAVYLHGNLRKSNLRHLLDNFLLAFAPSVVVPVPVSSPSSHHDLWFSACVSHAASGCCQ